MPPEGIPVPTPMTETLTPQEAVRVLKDASHWEDALVHRTEGITWMVWGLATPATFLTYSFAAVLTELEGLKLGWLWSVLWVPWIAGATATTVALWRSTALASPRLDDPRQQRRAGLYSLGFGLALFLAFLLLDPDSAVVPLGGIGAMWTLMGLLDPWRGSARGRRVALFVGSTLVVVALGLALTRAPASTAGLASLAASGLIPLCAGLYHTLRG